MKNLAARVASAVDLLRPRTFFRTLARVDSMVDAQRDLQAAVDALQIRTAQLIAANDFDWEHRTEAERLASQLDAARVGQHVCAAVERALLETDPFPHLVVQGWLPRDVYDAAIGSLPPAVFFADRHASRQRLKVPFDFAPAYSRRVWDFLANVIVSGPLSAAIEKKFAGVLREYVREICPGSAPDAALRLHTSDGRIMLRRPGYVIEPHRDPKWGFLTGLVYLARPGDDTAHGTQFYRVRDDQDAPDDRPFYVDASRCTLVKTVPFEANSLVVFLNSRGAHGASIPVDALPATLERYVYQFRLGPDANGIDALLSQMAPEHRRRWIGVKSDRQTR